MATGRGHFHGPAGLGLAEHVGEIERRELTGRGLVRLGGERAFTAQPTEDLAEVRRAEHLEVVDKGRFAEHRDRHDRAAQADPARGQQRGKHAANRPQPTVESQFAEQDRAGQQGFRDDLGRGQHAAGECDVVAGTALG